MKAYLDLTKHIISSNFTRLAFPYKLTFCITYWCNYRCKTCNIWQRKPKDELTLDEIKKFFEKSNRFNWIDFTGGEVWLRKDFIDIVESALLHCKNLVMVHFPTNGFMTEQIAKGGKDPGDAASEARDYRQYGWRRGSERPCAGGKRRMASAD